MESRLLDSHDLDVGRDAFLQDGRQIFADLGVEFSCCETRSWDLVDALPLSAVRLALIKSELAVGARTAFGESVDVSPATFLGQMIDQQARSYLRHEDLLLAIQSSTLPDTATGSALEALLALIDQSM